MSCYLCGSSKVHTELMRTKCNHMICLTDMSKYVKNNLTTKIKCPVENCNDFIRDKVIRQVLSDVDIEKYEDICLGKLKCIHTCLLKECGKKIIYTHINTQYDCPNCSLYNCVKCKRPHFFKSCDEYKSMDLPDRERLISDQFNQARRIVLAKKKKIVQESTESNNKIDLWPSKEIFSCQMCGNDIAKYAGVCLRSCLDLICRECLEGHVKSSDQIPIACPVCSNREICDREINALFKDTNEVKGYRQKCLNHARNTVRQLTNCREFNCNGIFYVEPNVKSVTCTRCRKATCISCNTVHKSGETCQQYLNKLHESEAYKQIEEQIKNRKLMRCPDCKTLIMRTSGCGWIQCTTCGTELCWHLQTYRWGPNGCKCGENGYCHEDCDGCIADVNRMIPTINSPSNNGGSNYSETNRPNRYSTSSSDDVEINVDERIFELNRIINDADIVTNRNNRCIIS